MAIVSTLLGVLLGYVVRHWDPFRIHAPADPLLKALRSSVESAKAKHLAELVGRLNAMGYSDGLSPNTQTK